MRLTSILRDEHGQPRAERRRASSPRSRSAPPTPASPTSPTAGSPPTASNTIRLPRWAQPPVRYQICGGQARPGADTAGAQRVHPARPGAAGAAASCTARRLRPAAAVAEARRRGARRAGVHRAPRALRRASSLDVPRAAAGRAVRRGRRCATSRACCATRRCATRSRSPSRTNPSPTSLILGFGTPAGYLLATRRFRGRALRRSRSSSCRSCCRPRSRASACWRRSAPAGCSATRSSRPGIVLPFTEWAVVLAVDVRRLAVLRAPGDRLVRGRRPARSPTPRARSAPARRGRSCASRCRSPRAAWSPAGCSRSRAASASSARRSSSPATCAARRRRSRSAIYEQLEANFDVALAIGILLVVLSADGPAVLQAAVLMAPLELDIAVALRVFRARRSA